MFRALMIAFTILLVPILCQNNDEVDSLLSKIKKFVTSTNFWKRPTDAKEYLKHKKPGKDFAGTYDFIIVGGGSAGTVLANRLSEISEWKILLLEAGGKENEIVDIPGLAGFLQNSDYNWGMLSTTQRNCCLGIRNQKCNFPRGKGLGGSSLINFMMYVRGNKKDFDKWCGLGNAGWCYDDVLPYFLKSEGAHFENYDYDKNYHNTKGPASVEIVRYKEPGSYKFMEAFEEMGYLSLDYNGKNQNGVSFLQNSMLNGVRCSGARAFLDSVFKRRNLKVLNKSYVTKLLVDEVHKNVFGVEFIRSGKFYTAAVTKEVILSAGSINSPQLLMLSGIGPAEHLQNLGVNIIEDRPVGQNMADHPAYFGLNFATNLKQNDATLRESVEDYLKGYGVLTSAVNIQAIAFLNSSNPSNTVPDGECVFLSLTNGSAPFLVNGLRYKTENIDPTLTTLDKYVFNAFLVLLHPKSRGSVTLKSKDPFDYPLIDLNYFSDPENHDIKTFIELIRKAATIPETEVMKKYNVTSQFYTIPACQFHEFQSDDYWECHLRHLAVTCYHPIGTCKMGPKDDPEAVVNSDLTVRGVNGLRVIDASVIPVTISGHTNAATFMIAEKGADVIKEYYGVL